MTNRIKLKGNKDVAIDLADGTITDVLALTDGQACSDTNDSMTADPETATESGYITITVGGSQKQIPFYDA